MTDPQLGVVVPTLNSAATLDWTLCTLRSQRGSSVRVMVVDSGSDDGTLETCKRWDVQTIYVPPGNMYRAINAGMKLLPTEWVTYLNSDDAVYSDAYARLMQLGNSTRADVVYGHCDYVDYFGRLQYPFFSVRANRVDALFRRGLLGFAQPAAIFRKDLFEALSGFDESYRCVGDLDFFARAAKSRSVFARLQLPTVAAFRLHPLQLSRKEAELAHKEKKTVVAALGLSAHLTDLLALLQWRTANAPNYVIRFLRSRRLRNG